MKKLLFLTTIFCAVLAISSGAAMFGDTESHWAEKDIDALVMAGVINGIDDFTFAPEDNVTREQFLKMLLIAANPHLDEKVGLQNPPAVNPALEISPYSDVDISRWSYSYIKEAFGTILPYTGGVTEFGPAVPITREEAAVWMSRALSLEAEEPAFTDNDAIADRGSVGAAAARGLINGFEDGSFRPAEHLTRAQAASMLRRLSDLSVAREVDRLGTLTTTHSMDNADLNKDGTNELINVYTDLNAERYVVEVNNHQIIGGSCDATMSAYYIADIDTSDSFVELLVIEQDFSDTAVAIYRYTGTELYALGYIENYGPMVLATEAIGDEWGAFSINGDGTINANIGVQYVHTMLVRKLYKIDAKNRLTDQTGELYYTIGTYSNFVTNILLESARSDEAHPAITMQPGYAGKIVATDLKNWIYIEAGNGESGWIYVGDDRLIRGEFLSHYVDGLWYAG